MVAMAIARGRPNRTKIETLEIRARIVDLSREGHSTRAIAAMVGFQSNTAVQQHLEAYRGTLTPSAELAEEWRNTKLARADERFRRLRAKSLGEQDDQGGWLVEPDYQALTALQREEDSITKMLGANLEVGISIGVFSAEQMAAVVWGADDAGVVEGTAVEVTDGA